MATRYSRNPRKRIIRGSSADELRPGGRRTSEEFILEGDDELPFVRLGSSTIGTQQDVVQRIGDAIIGGDFSGNARGSRSIDVQFERTTSAEVASGDGSIAFGRSVKASGDGSVALGINTAVTGNDGVALGRNSLVSAGNGVAVGLGASVSGQDGIAVGQDAVASGNYSAIVGQGTASGVSAVAVGTGDVLASGVSAIAMGASATASGARSIALGENALADQNDEFVIRALSIRMQTQSAPGVEEAVITTSAAAPVTGNVATWADVDRIGDGGVALSALTVVATAWNFLLLSAAATAQAALDRLDSYGMFVKTTVQSGATLTIPSGYQQIVYGPYTITGDIVIAGDLIIL